MPSVNVSKPGYQPEIDGLRAIAVTSVLLFHAGFASIGGGYVGVDVFFVISGYLITRIIVTEVERSGSFRFGNFYLRRVRRLFPAAICTILLSIVGGALLFSSENMLRLGISAAAAVLSASNFYFWAESGYFSPDVINKPLLHTWSLSVEEQFYMIWPALLVLVMTKLPRWTPVLLVGGLILASTALAEHWIFADRSAAFYLLPPRVAELGIGALMVWVIRGVPSVNLLREGALVLGLGLILYACLAFTDQTGFPGLNALIPCLGTALVLYGCEARIAGTVLRLSPVVWVGRISYSLYLVHWPVIVFFYAVTFTEFSLAERWIIVGLSFGLASLQYYFIEERFRHPVPGRASTRRFLLGSATGGMVTGLLAVSILLTNGWPFRIPADRFQASNRDQRHLQEELFCGSPDPSKPADLFTCQNYRGKNQDIVLWGDSHALHLVAGVSKWFPDYNINVMFVPGCVPQSGFVGYERSYGGDEKLALECAGRNLQALERFEDAEPTNIIISGIKSASPDVMAAASREILERLKAAGHNAVLIGDVIPPGRHLVDCVSVPGILLDAAQLRQRCTPDGGRTAEDLAYNDEVETLVDGFVSPNDVQCPDGVCDFFHDGRLLFRDTSHLNIEGSEYLIGQLRPRLPF